MSTMSKGDTTFTADFKIVAQKTDYIHALVAYFDVTFTACHKFVGFNTGPRFRSTHWKQTVFYLEDVIPACEGEALTGTLKCAPNSKNPRDLDIVLSYTFEGERGSFARTQRFRMR